MLDDLRRRIREEQADVARRTQALRVDLPFRYLRQQAHLTAPASEFSLASKALGGAHQVAARLLQRYGIEPSELASRADVNVSVVEGLLSGGGAPVVLLDLEDGVAPQMVPAARENAIRLLRDVDRGSSLCFLRPAGIEDPRSADDLVELLIGAGAGLSPGEYPLDGIVVPKIRHVHEVEWVERVLTAIEDELGLERNRIRVSYQVETGWGVLNLPDLAVAGRARLAGIILGTVDLSADLLLPEVRYRHPVCEWARTVIVAVAGSMGVPAIDGMTLDFPVGSADNTPAGNHHFVVDRMMANIEDARHSIDMGMSGRWTGHPLQLVATELAFAKAFSPESLEPQLADLEAFVEATSADRGAIAGSGGQLLDIGTDRHVRAVLRRAVAWGYIPQARALKLGLISDAELTTAGR
ncbi:MAG: HpcH/HpaI aldolase/citrate lyase family protein [Candidatus Dormibacteria bacterium]